MATDGQLLTTGQAAQVLGCSRQHVVDLCDSGKLPCAVIGSHRRVARGDLQRFLDEGKVLRREEERSLWALLTDPWVSSGRAGRGGDRRG
ncbi:helix-turn-helix domain-containing protein [Intrasporangium calvum]|uniref:helix-turn-helix domain-containing protein n=1 Tax=Intrasporangium calvum TaxID=53358 RepID=UPI001F2CF719|nr:helix-turn-helix domain-containing protein [Intrasporangium calvum]